MNNLRKKLTQTLLLSTLFCIPTIASATACPNPCPSVPDVVKAIATLPDRSTPDQTRQDASKYIVDGITQPLIDGITQPVIDGVVKGVVAGIVNYEAAARMQDYMYNQQLLFMAAPGSIWAINAGSVVGQSNTATTALTMSDSNLVGNLGQLTTATKLTLHGADYTIQTPLTAVTLYQQMKDFFKSGDTTTIPTINMGGVIQSDNLAKLNPAITQTQAQTLMNLIVYPFPTPADSAMQQRIRDDTLNGTDMELLGSKVASYAVMGVSASALSDIIARRIPASGQTKSVMEVMDDHSKERFQSSSWYNSLGAASEAALLREIAQMMAYNQWVAYQQFRISEQQTALLASINSVMSKMNISIDYLNTQLSTAQAQAKATASDLSKQLNQQGAGGSIGTGGSGGTGGITGTTGP